MDDLYRLLREDSLELESKFRRASIEGRGTAQEIADFRENALQSFVSRFFPFPHRVTKGKVRDTYGVIGDSVDCIVCNPNHPYTIDSHGKFRLLFAEGVDVAIEVKPNIGDHLELKRGLEQGISIKALKRRVVPSLAQQGWEFERAQRVPFVIFSMRCKSNPLDTLNEISEYYKQNKIEPIQQADFIAVNDIGLFVNYLHESMYCWNNKAATNARTGWFFEKWERDTLAGFIWRLQTLAHASIKIQEEMLQHYLEPKAIHGIFRANT
jgi:hypothetical protein